MPKITVTILGSISDITEVQTNSYRSQRREKLVSLMIRLLKGR